MFQIIFKALRSGGNKSLYLLKQICNYMLQVCLSMYDLFYHQVLKGQGAFLHALSFKTISLKSGLNFNLKKNKRDPDTQVYFQGGYINVLWTAFF